MLTRLAAQQLATTTTVTTQEHELDHRQVDIASARKYVQNRIQQNAEAMIRHSIRKGSTSYQYKIGDLVQLLRDLNSSKKSIAKNKKKLEKPYFTTLCKIVECLPNKQYRLEFVDGTDLPFSRETYTANHFSLWSSANDGATQQVTETTIEFHQLEEENEDASSRHTAMCESRRKKRPPTPPMTSNSESDSAGEEPKKRPRRLPGKKISTAQLFREARNIAKNSAVKL